MVSSNGEEVEGMQLGSSQAVGLEVISNRTLRGQITPMEEVKTSKSLQNEAVCINSNLNRETAKDPKGTHTTDSSTTTEETITTTFITIARTINIINNKTMPKITIIKIKKLISINRSSNRGKRLITRIVDLTNSNLIITTGMHHKIISTIISNILINLG